jgi:hypothetical protein
MKKSHNLNSYQESYFFNQKYETNITISNHDNAYYQANRFKKVYEKRNGSIRTFGSK